jgi:hypothetical protein
MFYSIWLCPHFIELIVFYLICVLESQNILRFFWKVISTLFRTLQGFNCYQLTDNGLSPNIEYVFIRTWILFILLTIMSLTHKSVLHMTYNTRNRCRINWCNILKNELGSICKWYLVYISNPSYIGSQMWEDPSLRPSLGKNMRTYLKNI